MQFTLHLMLKNLLNMEPGDPLASKILQDFLTFMKGFISIPINLPGTSFAKAFKVCVMNGVRITFFSYNILKNK